MERQEGLREEPSQQRQLGPSGVPGLGSRVHPREGVPHPGPHPQGGCHHLRLRQQRNPDAVAGQEFV